MEKRAVGKQMGGFMQTRAGIRPHRVDTLLEKDLHSRRPSDVLADPTHDAESKYGAALAVDEGDEFKKEGAAKAILKQRLNDQVLGLMARTGKRG